MRFFRLESQKLIGQPRIAAFSTKSSDDTGLAILVSEYDKAFVPDGEYMVLRWNDEGIQRSEFNSDRRLSEEEILVSRDFLKVSAAEEMMNSKKFYDMLLTVFQHHLIMNTESAVGVHAAVAVYQHQAIMFCGLPGAGKSTQVNLWKKFMGAWVLNYDKPGITFHEGKAEVFGTPWSGKEPCYINYSIPLRAIVFVEQSEVNHIDRMKKGDAFARMYLNFMPCPISDDMFQAYERKITRIVENVPVYMLNCTISWDAVKVTFEELFGDGSKVMSSQEKVPTVTYRIKEGFMLRQVAGEWVVIPRGRGALSFSGVMMFNETGAFLWERLQQPCGKDQLASLMACEYEIDYEVALRDVERFLEKLDKQGVVVKG